MTSMTYVVYDKDLARELADEPDAAFVLAKRKVKIGPVPFRVELEIANVSNPKAIQSDMLLKKLIREKTDKEYKKLPKLMAHLLRQHTDADPSCSDATLDAAWNDMQKIVAATFDRVFDAAVKEMESYLMDRNAGKLASKKANYKRYKSVLSATGAVGAVAASVAGTILSAGAGVPALVISVALAAKAVTGTVREFGRQGKEIDEVRASIASTLTTLKAKYDLGNAQLEKSAINRNEVLEKITSDLFETNLPSIKKLEQDTKLLEAKATAALLSASKMGSAAAPLDEAKRALKRERDALRSELEDLKKTPNIDVLVKTDILDTERVLAKLDKEIDALSRQRDDLVAEARKVHDGAKKILDTEVQGYSAFAAAWKAKRSDAVGHLGIVTKALPTLLGFAAMDYGNMGSNFTKIADHNDAIAGMVQQSGESLKELVVTLRNRYKKK